MRLRCYLSRNVHLIWVGRTLAGLFSQPDCHATLEFADWLEGAHSIAVEVEGTKLGIEMNDQTYEWDPGMLAWCDVYAKRNIDPDWKGTHYKKVIPYGIHLAAHSRRSAAAALYAIAAAYPRGVRIRPDDIYRYLVAPHWRDFEHHPTLSVDETILYQTRVWQPSEAPGDEIINVERLELLRALKAEFGTRLVGGLVPTEYSRKHFPELITEMPTRQPQYIAWAKRPAIGIYTRGLFGAIAIKMSEFLAGSKCIVADPIRNVLPAPLEHVAIYRSPEECVGQCANILGSRELRQSQREASWEYYNRYIQTPTAIRRILEIARDWK